MPWLVALPLILVGSLAAHALSYPLVAARAEGGQELAERSSSGLAAHSILGLGLVADAERYLRPPGKATKLRDRGRTGYDFVLSCARSAVSICA